MTNKVSVGKKAIGAGEPVYIIAVVTRIYEQRRLISCSNAEVG